MGTVTHESSTKDAQLFQQPLPMSDSSQAIILDLFGTSRTMTVSGIFTGTGGDIQAFIGQLDTLANGSQVAKTYHSDKTGVDYKVLVNTVEWSSEGGDVNKVNYTLNLIQSS